MMCFNSIAEGLFALASQRLFGECAVFIRSNLNCTNVNCLIRGSVEKTILTATCEYVCNISKSLERVRYLELIDLLLAVGAKPIVENNNALAFTLQNGASDIAVRLIRCLGPSERARELIAFMQKNTLFSEVKIIDALKLFVEVDCTCIFPNHFGLDMRNGSCFHVCLKHGWNSAFKYLWDIALSTDTGKSMLNGVTHGVYKGGRNLVQYAEWQYMHALVKQLKWYVNALFNIDIYCLLCCFLQLFGCRHC